SRASTAAANAGPSSGNFSSQPAARGAKKARISASSPVLPATPPACQTGGGGSVLRFPAHLGRRPVRSEPLEAWMAQAPVARPLRELHLPDQVGPGPVGGLLPDRIEERRLRNLTAQQLLVQLEEKLVGEPGSDLAGVPEPGPVVVVADQEGSQTDS